MTQPSNQNSLLISYLSLRKAVGLIGVALPFVLALGNHFIFHAKSIEDSISYYDYTHMSGVFVGSLCAIGVFLMSYRGYQKRDRVAGILACIFAIGVALFPTAQKEGSCNVVNILRLNFTGCDVPHWISLIHGTCATLLFLLLAYFSIFLFTETGPGGKAFRTPRKRERNVVYYLCGYLILAAIAAILVLNVGLKIRNLGPMPVTFSCESLAVIAFGVSWLVKGEFVLKDEPTSSREAQG